MIWLFQLFYKYWLLTTIEENNGCSYFGSLTEKLHNSLGLDTKLYRRDVKHMLADLLELIERLEMKEIIIEEYAQKHNVSTSGFIRNFKLCTGSTPMQYILSKRIYNAKILLKNHTYDISEIANIVGYENPLYFVVHLKK